MALENIPTIDLRDAADPARPGHAKAVQKLGDGLIEFGFVILDYHGVEMELVDRAYELFAELFALPVEEKLNFSGVEAGARGYTPFGIEHAKDHPLPDLKEFWHVGPQLGAMHPFRKEYPDNVWPEHPAALKEVGLELFERLEACGESLLECVAEYFDMPRRRFADMMVHGNSVLRAIHYPPIAEGTNPNAVRAAAHEDINLITLLVEATESGLEILSEGKWVPVVAKPGQIIADAGDMLARITNDVIPATTHRVVNVPGSGRKPRYSMPLFVHPWSACDLTVLPEFINEDRPAKYPPIRAGVFLEQRLREIGLKS